MRLMISILVFSITYMIVQPKLPEYAPAPWLYDAAVVAGAIIVILVSVWTHIESNWIMKQRKKPAQVWRKFQFTNRVKK